jgi:heptosyltransferase-2
LKSDGAEHAKPTRVLIVCPSWVGDAVMATPALRLIRSRLPGAFIGGLVRPGIDELLAGSGLLDEVHVEPAGGMMGPKRAAAKVRPRMYGAALLLTNSFSTALITRLAGIPRRVGYSRDARGILLTQKLDAPKRPDGRWAPIPAVAYYWHAAEALLDASMPRCLDASLPQQARLELAITPAQDASAAAALAALGIAEAEPLAILNPGGNNPAKRWPPDRFAAVAAHLSRAHGLTILVSGSPAEGELCASIAAAATQAGAARALSLANSGLTLGPLKAVIRRARLMVSNDTGPRHIAAAFNIPVVSLFGPTDHRWTTIPAPAGEAVLLADPTLPETDVADDHPARCRVDRIEIETVIRASEELLSSRRVR